MKKIFSLLLIAALTFTLCSCGGKEETPSSSADTSASAEAVSLSAEESAEQLLSQVEANADLEKSEFPLITLEKYDVDTSGVSDICWYVGSGASADELAVIVCADSETLASVKAAINSRIEYLRDGYSDYGPDQVPKIDSALVAEYGNTVVYCICEDSAAAKTAADSIFA